MATKQGAIWFNVKRGKTHELIFPEDSARFPLGRAKCAPFGRETQDEVMETNAVGAGNFCPLCISGVK